MCEGHCAQRSACSAEEFTKRKDMRSHVSALCEKAVSVGVLVLCARRPLRPARLCFVSYRYGSGRYF